MSLEILILFSSTVTVMMMMRGPTPSCSPGGLLSNRSPLVFLDRWYPCFTNFDSIIPVDVTREKSHVNSFLDSSGVPVWVSINKFPSCWRAQKRRRSGYRLNVYPSRVLFSSLAEVFPFHRCFAAFTGNRVNHTVLPRGIYNVLWSY